MAVKELTTGNPLKLIFLFMLPMFFGNMFQQFYNLIDALIVGRTVGIGALASVGATGPVIMLVISFVFASTQGFTVITAQKFGARDYDMLKKSVSASFILSILLTIIMTAISLPFTKQILYFLRTPQDILSNAEIYLFIMFAGIFATVFYNLSSNIIRALGDSKTPLYFLIFASFLNIFLDLVFILKFKMGVMGAGLATVVSQGISTVLCLIFMFKHFPILKLKKEDWKVSKDFFYEHLRIGIPMGFQMSILTIGIIAVQYVLNGFGSIAVAAFTTAVRVDQLVSQSLLALGAAMATYTAQNIGANKIERVRKGAHAALFIAFIISVICAVFLITLGKSAVALFMDVPNEEVIRLAMQYLHIIMVCFFFLGALLIYRNILQGIGNVFAPLLSGVAELIARIFAAFVLGHYFGYTGVCLAPPFAWIVAAIVLYLGYKISLTNKIKKCRGANT
ncbi:MAG: MATE family efflux transporter [Candidatus Gastranaerophilales bacterium]|nr:MATE family efflux transporter [Candidatus Gastranaerophilales bacterium]